MTPLRAQRGYPPRGEYSHLHVRSGFSYGLGTATPEELVGAAAEAGYRTLALTDRDGLYGVPRFLKACGERGLSPVVGAEVSVGNPVGDRDEPPGGARGHVVLLAQDARGYRSLCKLITCYRMRTEGGTAAERRNPRATLEDIAEHAPGLVCLTGAVPFGLLPSLVLGGRSEGARAVASLLREAFDGRLFVEITDDSTGGSRGRMRRVEAFAEGLGLPVVAAHEVAYLRAHDHRLHEVLVAAANLTGLPGPGYRPTDQLHLKDANKMGRLFRDRPAAIRNAARISERCADAVDLSGRRHMPAARLPEGVSAARRLAALAVAGVKKRYRAGRSQGEAADRGGRLPASAGEVKARLRRELSCIQELGFAPYFLVAHEAAAIARERGIPVTGRGSAANSLVCYAIGLTQPEPFKNRLLYERFMSEERTDTPDIDLDFCSLRRDEVRDELASRYEEFGVAVASTAATMSLRGAVRTAARALGHPPREIDALSKGVPTRFVDRGRVYAGEVSDLEGWREVLRQPQMRGHPLQDTDRHGLLLELSSSLAGRLREAGTHLGGMVFGNHQFHLSELVPLEPSGTEGLIRCQYDKDALELCGIPKLDVLGLRTHTALSEAGRIASGRSGKTVDPYDLPPDDRATFSLVRTGRTAGIFQLESPGQMHLSRRLRPRNTADLVAQISLFRPGPVRGDLVTPYVARRHAREPYSVPLPELDAILRPTFGVLLYQEQVLEIARAVGGFSLAEGDRLRRAMTKDRGPGAMNGLRHAFVRGAVARGVPAKKAGDIFSLLENFSVYGFPKAHAASFAELSYATAYMRTHHPASWFCSLLNSQPMGFYSPRVLLNEARRAGVGVLPPDVHLSGDGFTVEEDGTALGALRVGLRYCRGISRAAIDSILEERELRPFASVAELYRRTRADSDHAAALVAGGFLDRLGDRETLAREAARLPKKPRRGVLSQPELPLPHPASWWESRAPGGLARLPALDGARRRISGQEREQRRVLGLDIRDHPLAPYRDRLERWGVVPADGVLDLPHGTRARAAGLLESVQSPPTKSGKPVWFAQVEDSRGLLQATVFGDAYSRFGHVLYRSRAVVLEGAVEQDERRGFSFVVERIADLGAALAKGTASGSRRRSRRIA